MIDMQELARALVTAPRNLSPIESLEAIFAAMERASHDPAARIPTYLMLTIESARQSRVAEELQEENRHRFAHLNDEARGDEQERRRMEACPEDYR